MESEEAFNTTNKTVARVITKQANQDILDAVRNKIKLKHAMLGDFILNSPTSVCKLDIIGDEEQFKEGLEYA